jgi:molybdopterin/thiamine biosynthesis adenylyltransferase
VAKIAEENRLAGHKIEAAALKMDVFPSRYLRNMQSISARDQIRLLTGSIAQVGLGGLGGTLLDLFLRAGIGRIRVADGDNFEETNLNRQALADLETLSRSKADATRGKAETVNPSVELEIRDEFLDPTTFFSFVEGCALAVDALGGLSSRLALQQAASEANIPLVTGALAGWTGYVSVVLPGATGPAEIMGHDNGAEEQMGCPAPAVTLLASIMASETMKLLAGTPSPLSGKMLIADLRSLTFDTMEL